mmetsp:Transcript_3876/g.7593  ORF Transcript_3876/g.7593 Transcript_3876/m.7593 type:complete len:98 (+) Transcript_3876:522-815(+)
MFFTILRQIRRVFTETMRLEGCWDESRMKKQSLGKDFQFMKKNFFVRLITYPLNLIPFAGAALYSAINGTYFRNIYHRVYFCGADCSSMLLSYHALH